MVEDECCSAVQNGWCLGYPIPGPQAIVEEDCETVTDSYGLEEYSIFMSAAIHSEHDFCLWMTLAGILLLFLRLFMVCWSGPPGWELLLNALWYAIILYF
ncbi:MAG: hypothetical protein WGN25_19505 [Candidatus Electrothrix sp. GW3-4]|uniref:hypothetical protein n=1 Tax=Candidatus Electrothrix sp. GW3-4 TaxID=3126740 RepID=UPI0030CA8931